jgi:simple sugar transport system permease protein
MSAAATTPQEIRADDLRGVDLAPISWKAPIAYGALALISILGFAAFTPSSAKTQFIVSTEKDLVVFDPFSIPSQLTAWLCGIVLVLLAGWVYFRTSRRLKVAIWVPVVFGTLFVLAFLTWVMADNQMAVAMTGMLESGLFLSVPLVFGSMAGAVCERVGVINVAIEGQLLAGAFFAATLATTTGSPYVGMLGAPLAGAFVGGLLALFAVRYWVDHIIVGVVLNVLVTGVTNYLYSAVLVPNKEALNKPGRLATWDPPILGDIPIIGPVIFRQNVVVYVMYAIVIALQILLFKSKWGLRLRACGEHPKAADTVGIKVNRTRVRNTILGGAIAGLGGAFFTVAQGLSFEKEMSAGKGFIALAAMILGRWNPKGALGAALLFGFATSLQAALSPANTPIPGNILLMTPYLITILAVAGLVGRVVPPAAEGQPYKG